MSTKPPKDGYRLLPDQVPDFPASNRWVEQLRWCLAVMDHDTKEIGFLAGLLSYAAKEGGLTERQAKYASKVVERISDDWLAGNLACQGGRREKPKVDRSAKVVPLHPERRDEATQ